MDNSKVIQELMTINQTLKEVNEKQQGIINHIARENETLSNLVKEVRTALKDFKRQRGGRQLYRLFKKFERLEGVDIGQAKIDILKCVMAQRASMSGISKVFKRHMDSRNKVIDERVPLIGCADDLFEAVVCCSERNAAMALSLLISMLVVLMDIEEKKLQAER